MSNRIEVVTDEVVDEVADKAADKVVMNGLSAQRSQAGPKGTNPAREVGPGGTIDFYNA